MTILLELSLETQRKLEALARRSGQDVESVAHYLIEKGVEEGTVLEDEGDSFAAPPNTIRDKAHLEQLLLQGLASPKREMTDQDWRDIRQTVRDRLAACKQEG